MTEQEFNHIYFKYTGNKKGIKPMDKIHTTGYELREFLEFGLDLYVKEKGMSTSLSLF